MTRPDDAPTAPPVLPDAVRARVVGLAADLLGRLGDDEVPAALARFARFTPAKRARLAGPALAVTLETDPVFRQRVAEHARSQRPELAEAVAAGLPVPAAEPEDVAAVAYLLRPDGWPVLLDRAAADLAARAATAAGAAGVDAVERLTEQLEALRAAARAQAAELRAAEQAAREDAAAARQEVQALRRKVRELGARAAQAERAAAAGGEDTPQAATDPAVEDVASAAEVRRLRARLRNAESALAAARAAGREERQASELRLRLLLDALVGAAHGLRQELALPPARSRPGDAVAAEYALEPLPAAAPAQGRADDDPGLLDELLALPAVHLLVDGYNVTKSAYGEQTLEVQRGRLLTGLAGLAARTRAEVTVVFDGVDRVAALATPSPRGVRLVFSATGETADDVLRRLVRAEPPGRPLVVVTSDREIVESVRDVARAVPSRALARLLER